MPYNCLVCGSNKYKSTRKNFDEFDRWEDLANLLNYKSVAICKRALKKRVKQIKLCIGHLDNVCSIVNS